MSNQKATFRFSDFVVTESHIVFREKGEYNLNILFSPKGTVLRSLSQFVLDLGVEVKDAEDKLQISIQTQSTFNFDEGVDIEAYKSSYFVTNAPALSFPYIRSYISSLTAQSGLVTITLPTLNLTSLASSLKDNIVEVD